MCGIIGYVGSSPVEPILVDGLKRLEYRGYDSAGIAILEEGRIFCEKAAGRLDALVKALDSRISAGTAGIGHTRWATHGIPNRTNAHPHLSCNGRIAVVHNGIIENHRELRRQLEREGHRFSSETDTEVIPHLLEKTSTAGPLRGLQKALSQLEGAFALAVLLQHKPGLVLFARRASPLVIALLDSEGAILASDVPAFLPYTRKVLPLDDGEWGTMGASEITVYGPAGQIRGTWKRGPKRELQLQQPRGLIPRTLINVTCDVASAEKGGYPHFMLKEIHEQPEALKATLSGRMDHAQATAKFQEDGEPSASFLRRPRRVVLVACGTAWHAGLVTRYALEDLAAVPAQAELASEFRYASPVIGRDTLVVAISQSGETADTLACVRYARAQGARTLAITNVVGSSLTRESDAVLYTRAGPEIGVASTKAYSAQLALGLLLAIHMGRLRGTLTPRAARPLLREIESSPDLVRKALASEPQVQKLARKNREVKSYMYIARHYNLANAYEGALKLKEISYLHAEGYGGGEMKHGPLALVDDTFPTVAIAVAGTVHDKMMSNLQEIKARRGRLLVVANPGDLEVQTLAEAVIEVPETAEAVSPIVTVVPLQLLAYHVGVGLRNDVDRPRNLAKSVTVE